MAKTVTVKVLGDASGFKKAAGEVNAHAKSMGTRCRQPGMP